MPTFTTTARNALRWLTGSNDVRDIDAGFQALAEDTAARMNHAGDLKHGLQTADHDGWLICDGRSLVRASYADLFTVVGTTYGAADGTHFNLPDLRGRTLVGLGTHADVNSLSDSDGLAVASRTPKHKHYSPWPFSENGGGGNFVGYASSVDNAFLTRMGYALRTRFADSTGYVQGVIGKLTNAASAAANAGAMSNADNNYTDIATVYDVASDLAAPAYGVANIFVKT